MACIFYNMPCVFWSMGKRCLGDAEFGKICSKSWCFFTVRRAACGMLFFFWWLYIKSLLLSVLSVSNINCAKNTDNLFKKTMTNVLWINIFLYFCANVHYLIIKKCLSGVYNKSTIVKKVKRIRKRNCIRRCCRLRCFLVTNISK